MHCSSGGRFLFVTVVAFYTDAILIWWIVFPVLSPCPSPFWSQLNGLLYSLLQVGGGMRPLRPAHRDYFKCGASSQSYFHSLGHPAARMGRPESWSAEWNMRLFVAQFQSEPVLPCDVSAGSSHYSWWTFSLPATALHRVHPQRPLLSHTW